MDTDNRMSPAHDRVCMEILGSCDTIFPREPRISEKEYEESMSG